MKAEHRTGCGRGATDATRLAEVASESGGVGAEDTGARLVTSRPGASGANGRKRVLIVEDDDSVANFYRLALRKSDYILYRAANGEEAIRLVDSSSFDAILSDLAMPGMDGIQLLRAVREQDRDVPIVIVTGNPEVESAITAVECGALRYLVKPVEPGELRDIVARAIEARTERTISNRAMELMGSHRSEEQEFPWTEEDFHHALTSLYMAYQPIVRPLKGQIVGYEALVRSRSAVLGQPLELLSAAQELGAIHELGRRVRATVARTLPSLPKELLIFVNIHAHELLDEQLYTSANPLRKYSGRIVIELTEQSQVDNVESRVKNLRSLGFLFAVDDLGSGYAALTHLVRFEPDFAKIDLNLVRDIDTNASKRMLVASLARICRELRIQLVCEGVETVAEGLCLLDLEAETLQGFYFAKPGPSIDAAEREELVRRMEEFASARRELVG
jgi:EAL domain-containing protein (putative c-di-GMP-specific phosphodiesterase class I)/CheY-like chemotaxis protein